MQKKIILQLLFLMACFMQKFQVCPGGITWKHFQT